MKQIYISLAFLFFVSLNAWSQKDTITLVNEDVLVGEIEKLDKSVLTFSTDYSDSDFKIEWDKVLEIKSQRTFIMAFSDGVRVTGNLNSIPEMEKKVRVMYDGQTEEESLNDLIFLEPIGKGALSNLSIDVDLGITLTKANNFRQLNTYIGGTYLAKRWNANAFFKTVLSSQDNTADIRRMDAEVGGQYFLPHDWFVTARAKYLANDEQLLDLRQTYQAGAGYYFIHNNSMYLALSAGAAVTSEIYTNENPERNSAEGFIGLGFQKYSIGDLSFLTTAALYPSFTESGRYRVDLNGDLKYDLPLDFYIKLSLTYNYDSQPTEGAADSDYVFTTSFGWEFN
jgi:hypothetical protein